MRTRAFELMTNDAIHNIDSRIDKETETPPSPDISARQSPTTEMPTPTGELPATIIMQPGYNPLLLLGGFAIIALLVVVVVVIVTSRPQ